MGANQRFVESDAIRTITQHKESGKVTLPKRQLKQKLGIDVEDLYGENVPIEIDQDRHAIIIDLPEPE